MKIAPRETESFLANPRCRVILIYGPNEGLREERANKLLNLWLGASGESATALVADEIARQPSILAEALSGPGLFQSAQAVKLIDPSGNSHKFLEDTLETMAPASYLLVLSDELPAKSPLRKFFESSPQYAALACYEDDAQTIARLMQTEFRARNVPCPSLVFDYLSTHIGTDRKAMRQELEKLFCYLGNDNALLTLENCKKLFSSEDEADITQLGYAIAERNIAESLRHIKKLGAEGMHGIVLLRGLSRFFQRLYEAKGYLASGLPEAEALKQLRPPVFFKELPRFSRLLRTLTPSGMERALAVLQDAEYQCKRYSLSAQAAEDVTSAAIVKALKLLYMPVKAA